MESLDNRENNYLLSIFQNNFGLSLSYCDISTGAIFTIELKGSDDFIAKQAIDQIEKINPSEIIINENYKLRSLSRYLNQNTNIFINYIDDDTRYEKRADTIIEYLGDDNLSKIEDKRLSIVSLANLLDYIYKFYDENLKHINNIEVLEISNYLELEANTRNNLELHRNLNNNTKDDTVLKILDQADTVMGSRIINEWLERPLVDLDKINRRLDIVEYFFENTIDSQNISNFLNDIYDLERLVGKISYKRANARDLISLKNSLKNVPDLKKYLEKSEDQNIKNLGLNLPEVNSLYKILEEAIVDDPPISITEGGIIKIGFNNYLDDLKNESENAVSKLATYESQEREKDWNKKL
ncbi:MutS family DNA mismatch repair protein [Anaerococcus cruorum]|uniref:hypothetical protein n=1 Tax=Anaerococcus sp. WGS1596 TaxID=3366806 RepID=UPI00372D79CC